MPEELRMLFLLAAVLVLVAAAAIRGNVRMAGDNRVRVLAAGVALFIVPFLWDAIEALD